MADGQGRNPLRRVAPLLGTLAKEYHVPVDLALLPTSDTVAKHLDGYLGFYRSEPDGFSVVCESSFGSGVLLLWGSLLIGVMMPISPKLMDRFGPRWVTIAGLLGVALFMYMLRDINVNTSAGHVIWATLVRGLGIGLMFTPVTAVALNSVPKRSTGMASSMLNLLHQVGFKVLEVTGHPAHPGVFFGTESPRLIVLAERS